ncbi:COP1-interactive protein 1-like [Manihot esculenta]|uniref:NAB domain-containing protein n=1 Tax=Manihot esculenta TaxID=3983 RepID=A0A2C9V3U1_MANES|nr:COP1-interactive protein 1-like [Manihot esculenta]
MKKRHWRESIKSFFGCHIDPEQGEQLKGTKTEIENKVKKILKLLKEEDLKEKDGLSGENSKKESLVQLIEDFHNQYQLLYEQYDHLTGELRNKFHGKRGADTSSSSSSESESDHSSKGKGNKNGKLKSKDQKIVDVLKHELETTNLEVVELKSKLIATNEEKEALNLEHQTALSKIKETEEIIRKLKFEVKRLGVEKGKLLVENGELKQNLDASGNVEAELNKRLEEMSKDKDDLIVEGEKIVEELKTIANHLQEEKVVLEQQQESFGAEVARMKQQLESAELQVSDLSQRLTHTEESNKSLASSVLEQNSRLDDMTLEKESLTAQVNTLLADLERLYTQKVELEEQMASKADETSIQVKGLMDQVNELQQQQESIGNEKAELEVKLEEKTREISEFLVLIENLKEETAHKTEDYRRILEERESLTGQMKHLELEVENLQNQKAYLEEQIRTEIKENGRLGEDMVGLQNKFLDFERTLKERGLEFLALQERHEKGENEAFAKIMALIMQANNLKLGLDSLPAKKNQLQLQLEKEKQQFRESLIGMENQKFELMSKIADQQKMLAEQEEAYRKLSEEYKQVEGWFQERKDVERKVEEMAAQFQKNAGSKDQIVAELEETVENLKRDLKVKGDELNTLVDHFQNIEVKLRLSNQKLRVTEQLLTEKEESFRKAEANFQRELKVLEERIATKSRTIAATKEACQRMVTDASEKVKSTLRGVEALSLKFEDDCKSYEHRIMEISNEIQIAKNKVIEMKNDKEQLGKEVGDLVVQLQVTKERESTSRAKIEQLEAKIRKDEGEKENLTKAVSQLEKKVSELEIIMKEKDKGILDLGEEKREAIRQLCLWIEYHRSH